MAEVAAFQNAQDRLKGALSDRSGSDPRPSGADGWNLLCLLLMFGVSGLVFWLRVREARVRLPQFAPSLHCVKTTG